MENCLDKEYFFIDFIGSSPSCLGFILNQYGYLKKVIWMEKYGGFILMPHPGGNVDCLPYRHKFLVHRLNSEL